MQFCVASPSEMDLPSVMCKSGAGIVLDELIEQIINN